MKKNIELLFDSVGMIFLVAGVCLQKYSPVMEISLVLSILSFSFSVWYGFNRVRKWKLVGKK